MIPGATLPRLAECRDCHEPIRFVKMETTGRNMPVNPLTNKSNNPGAVAASLRGSTMVGYVITLERPGDLRYPHRFTPHYATCRKHSTAPPTPAADTPLF
jgi:hypothetical protein